MGRSSRFARVSCRTVTEGRPLRSSVKAWGGCARGRRPRRGARTRDGVLEAWGAELHLAGLVRHDQVRLGAECREGRSRSSREPSHTRHRRGSCRDREPGGRWCLHAPGRGRRGHGGRLDVHGAKSEFLFVTATPAPPDAPVPGTPDAAAPPTTPPRRRLQNASRAGGDAP
jgi:hypothetical protein